MRNLRRSGATVLLALTLMIGGTTLVAIPAQANICDDAAAAGWHHSGLNTGCILFFLMIVEHYGDYVP